MPATLLDGRAVAQQMRATLQDEVGLFQQQYGYPPRLAVVQVAGVAASDRYVRNIRKQCEAVGMAFQLELLPEDVAQAVLEQQLAHLSAEAAVHGILLQLPLPAHLSLQQALFQLDYRKDVDGIHPTNAGLLVQGQPALLPNPPAGGIALLKHYNIPLKGRNVAMVGWGMVVGRPMTALLLRENATVLVCHSQTADIPAILRVCDIVVVAVGKPELITGEMLRPGAVVIDFGINVQPDGSMVGDVDFNSAFELASAITPVPGGTGPMTNVMLLQNVLMAARQQQRNT
ncbi:MAG: bifunctional 5,10-methylenetetrahydrofolate dehydrogenase/5,10-methenyltetrahydrofolate cyclohydrolase [Chloroflexaceae bacterium]|nr:bifunctional 5,10-methylenetetrahydrofolate dehydrogenase/5,10-methenyltetrahydrofolate cyclohydrolase [Chloroflexaceae bacterium]NJO07135.1 bifunctional 5,10-methylenetetrahydrofolate dehydrogenase/5,10-methenyltetrahydrofolate cyclohydrolase [Chloroflexaceae bacterium]